MNVTEDILPLNFQRGRKGAFPPDTIVIHVTEGDADSVRAWFHDPSSEVSAHYMVCKSGEIVHFVHESDTAWANGRVDHPTAALVLERVTINPNCWTISIEHEGDGTHELTDPQRASSLALMRDIQTRHHRITFDRHHILGHHEIYSLKTCPGAISVDRLVQELNEVTP
jgi:N-acetyl-anhydromuramyl-L-alanine amidase AmpD